MPVRRPANDEFIMVSRVPEHCFPAFLYEDPILGECYIPKSTRNAGWLGNRERPVQLQVYVTVLGEECLWPIPLPRPTVRDNPYSIMQREHASAMLTREPPTWASIRSNTAIKTYEITWAAGDLGAPKFTGRALADMLKAAFSRDRIIDRFEHPALRRLRGNRHERRGADPVPTCLGGRLRILGQGRQSASVALHGGGQLPHRAGDPTLAQRAAQLAPGAV